MSLFAISCEYQKCAPSTQLSMKVRTSNSGAKKDSLHIQLKCSLYSRRWSKRYTILIRDFVHKDKMPITSGMNANKQWAPSYPIPNRFISPACSFLGNLLLSTYSCNPISSSCFFSTFVLFRSRLCRSSLSSEFRSLCARVFAFLPRLASQDAFSKTPQLSSHCSCMLFIMDHCMYVVHLEHSKSWLMGHQ